MKGLVAYLVGIALFYSALIQGQINHVGLTKELAASESRLKSLQEFILDEESPSQSTIHLEAYWKLSPAQRFIDGYVKHTFLYDASKGSNIRLLLSNELEVDSVLSSAGISLNFNHNENKLEVDLLQFADGELIQVEIYYHGEPPSSGFGSFEINQSPYGRSYIYTLSEPYGSGDWWPCPVYRNSKIDSIDVFIETPSGMLAAGNGLLQSIDSSGVSWIHHWKHKYRIAPYLISTVVGDYFVRSDTVNLRDASLPILDYVYPEENSIWEETDPRFPPMIQFVDSLLLPYPFSNEKYGHAQFPWSGGMEHQTMSSMRNPDETLKIHELAHQWFGNLVTCGSWSDIWLNEGFATYLTAVYFERFRPDEFEKWKKDQKEFILSIPGGSIYVSDTNSVTDIFSGRLSYSKAAMVLHMLRNQIGDVAFFNALRNYLTEFSSNGFAKTVDFVSIVESACSCDLQQFFQNWIFEQGHALVSVNWSQNLDVLEFELTQSTSVNSTDLKILKLPVLLQSDLGDSLIYIDLTESTQTFIMNVDFICTDIIIDPKNDVLVESRKNHVLSADISDDYLLYPNPSSTDVYLISKSGLELPKKVSVYDGNGKLQGEFEVSTDGRVRLEYHSSWSQSVSWLVFIIDNKRFSLPYFKN
jgi:aminopeptidase N